MSDRSTDHTKPLNCTLEKGVTFLFASSPLTGMEMEKLHLW